MAASFDTTYVKNVGSTETVLYTAPPGLTGRHLIIGIVSTNTFGSAIPITAKLVRGADTVYIAYNKRVLANDSVDLLINNSKIMIENGDEIKVSAPVDNAFSVIMTVIEEVET